MDAFWATLIISNVWMASSNARGGTLGAAYLLLAVCIAVVIAALRVLVPH